jgi:hypothetical protein
MSLEIGSRHFSDEKGSSARATNQTPVQGQVNSKPAAALGSKPVRGAETTGINRKYRKLSIIQVGLTL